MKTNANTTSKEIKTMDSKTDLMTLYKTQWQVYFKRGLSKPVVVYGEDEKKLWTKDELKRLA